MEGFIMKLKDVIRGRKEMDAGLFSGNMGICLSLYLINRSWNDRELESMADDLLDKTINSIKMMKDPSFDRGLAGIGWAINYLHIQDCLEGDIDEILHDIDALIYKSICKQDNRHTVDFTNGLIGFLVYMTYRFKNCNHKKEGLQHQICEATLRIVIDKLEVMIPNRFCLLSKDKSSSILWDFPILFYCLGEALRLEIYKEKISSMINNWSYLFTVFLPSLDVNRLALANSLAFVNSELNNSTIKSYIDTLFYSVNFQDYLYEIEKKNIVLCGDWFCALLNMYESQKMMSKKHVRYADLERNIQSVFDLYREDAINVLDDYHGKNVNCSMINGYSGALLAFTVLQNLSSFSNISE